MESNIQKITNKKPSVKKNYIYNVLYQLFTMLIPLITTPYLSKVLGSDGIGKYSFTYSIANYFILLASLGFGYYAQREISKVCSNKEKQSIIFYEILIVRFFSVCISVIIYVILLNIKYFSAYSYLMWFWTILIATQAVDIAFLFQGNEEFGKIVFRNLIIKTIGIVCIFLFVKTKDDIWKYILFFCLSNVLGSISLWFYLPKYICKIKISSLKPSQHIIPTLRLFIPTIASSIYTILDKTLIGALIDGNVTEIIDGVEVVKKISDIENGYYEQTQKIIIIITSIITALGTVLMPRNSKLYENKEIENFKKSVEKAFRFVVFIACPMAVGLYCISENLVPWFLGQDFIKCIGYLKLFSPIIFFIGINNVLGIQVLIPMRKDNIYTFSTVAGAVFNLCLNCLLIPRFYALGAIISSIISEILIIVIMYIGCKKSINIKIDFKNMIKYFLLSLIMGVIVYISGIYLEPSILNTLILIFEGGFIYILSLVLIKDELVLNALRRFSVILKKIYK